MVFIRMSIPLGGLVVILQSERALEEQAAELVPSPKHALFPSHFLMAIAIIYLLTDFCIVIYNDKHERRIKFAKICR
jgi:hypothetical protein